MGKKINQSFEIKTIIIYRFDIIINVSLSMEGIGMTVSGRRITNANKDIDINK